MASRQPESSSGQAFKRLLIEALRAAGWKVVRPADGQASVHALFSKGKARYAVVLKAASEGRRDRLVPLLAQAILEAQSQAGSIHPQPKPLAVIAAPSIAQPVLRHLQQFAASHGSGVALGVMDSEGLRAFSGPGLEDLNSRSRPKRNGANSRPELGVDLFSDLNQWMLKIVLAPDLIQDELLRAPVSRYKNASELANAAQVSVMSAFRFLRQLDREGFLSESRDQIRLVRVEELLRRWQAAYSRPIPEVGVRWLLSGSRERLKALIKALGDRACLGLFAAARACKLGHVQGVPVHVLVDRIPHGRWKQLGLIEAQDSHAPDLVFRVPSARESVFRGAVQADGFLVSDVIQTWLDVGLHPARGREQADLIYRKVIAPMINSAKVASSQDV
ncbi:MAG TPA: hypothetical protein VFV78_10900 [Vicinamibacterales bacterium]|nr:hypothetical protein [Vicinamibacterales bacterium]